MVASLADAERLAVLTDAERRLLSSPERPIVIVERRPDAPLAPGVAPGNPTVGLMLPYTPLHHLLVESAGRPLVMTSGNLSDEPIAYRNDGALASLGRFVDVFLLHDRDIDTRCDDSVARVIAGQITVFRRSRGFVPRAIRVSPAFDRPTLACGALLKNTCCLGVGDAAWLGPHTGDLENLETFEAFEHAVERLCQFVGVTPEVVACDLHPDYLSTRYARRLAGPLVVGVQHHHAHLVSALAEQGLSGPALGVVFDGTGFGTDGTSWGGEFLAGDARHATRVATFRPLPLAGGDVAIRQVWRQALALLLDAFGPDAPVDRLPIMRGVPGHERTVVTQMLAAGLNSPLARGVGRYFDAVGALGLGRAHARFEGQVALEWNLVADPDEGGGYPYATADEQGLVQIDLRPTVRALTADLLAGSSAGVVSARFHNTLAEAAAATVAGLLSRLGPMPVVLSGGCFQNARLTEGIVGRLGSAVQVVRHHTVPPGDGGLALGQAVIADAQVRAGAPLSTEAVCVSAFPAA
jgi:hydrogenase maturation protein HypF